MNTDRYARLKALVLAALERPEGERDAFLIAECVGDDDLLDDARALLGQAPPRLMVDPAPIERSARAMIEGSPTIPDRIGDYTVRGVLGEGGMGVVYDAVENSPLARDVAIKVVRAGLGSDRILTRFELERRALARMTHPNIATVLDAGADASGRPYFVMERVHGLPITRYADEHALSIPERLQLLLHVVSAVRHAHRRGIIHRDLKPSNVLVSDDGVPKVIDFGIAKATSREAETDVPLTTIAGQLMGTPEYMSPEQAGIVEQDVDTRTDVYSLGVILYELLTGHRPLRFERYTPAELHRVLRDAEPVALSTVVTRASDDDSTPEEIGRRRASSPARLRRDLSGDLDTIVRTAMAKDPERRYASADALAEDMRRALDHRPVLARPDDWWYRLQKLARRQPLAVAGFTIAAVALIGAGTTLVVQSERVRQQRDLAVAAESRAERVTDILVDVFASADPVTAPGREVTVREALDAGIERVYEEFADEPTLQGELLTSLAEVRHGLGENAAAEALARDAAARLPDPSVARARALYLMGTAAHDGNDLRGSLNATQEAVEVLESAAPDHPELPGMQAGLGISYQALGRLDEAAEAYGRSLEGNLALHGPDHPEVAWSRYALGWLAHRRGLVDEAEAQYREALRIQQAALGPVHPDIAATLNNLAGVAYQRADRDAAEAISRDAFDQYRTLYPGGHVGLARAYGNLARDVAEQGRLAEALKLASTGLEMMHAIAGPEHRYAIAARGRVTALTRLLGDDARADSLLQEEWSYAAAHDPATPRLASLRTRSAAQAIRRGDLAHADSLLAITAAMPDLADWSWVPHGIEAVEALFASSRNEEAQVLLKELVDRSSRTFPNPEHTLRIRVEALVAEGLRRAGRCGEARPRFDAIRDAVESRPVLAPIRETVERRRARCDDPS